MATGLSSSSHLESVHSNYLISQIQEAHRKTRLDSVVGFFSLILILPLLVLHSLLGFCMIFICGAAYLYLWNWEHKRRQITLEYKLTSAQMAAFTDIVNAFNSLMSCAELCCQPVQQYLSSSHERKQHAGASRLVRNDPVYVGFENPPWVKTNLSSPKISAGTQTIFFMPDFILAYVGSRVDVIEYREFQVHAGTTRFITEKPPRDATIVDQTWAHPNRDGGPDRRFRNNYQIPVCLYGEVAFRDPAGVRLEIATSRADIADQFAQGLNSATTQLANTPAPTVQESMVESVKRTEPCIAIQSENKTLVPSPPTPKGFWRIAGKNQITGREVEMTIKADSKAEAVQIGQIRGVTISQVTPTAEWSDGKEQLPATESHKPAQIHWLVVGIGKGGKRLKAKVAAESEAAARERASKYFQSIERVDYLGSPQI